MSYMLMFFVATYAFQIYIFRHDVCIYLFPFFSAMKPTSFYGKSYEVGVPEESEDENLESEDEEYDVEKDLEDLPYEDDPDDEGSEDEEVPSTSAGGKKVKGKVYGRVRDQTM